MEKELPDQRHNRHHARQIKSGYSREVAAFKQNSDFTDKHWGQQICPLF